MVALSIAHGIERGVFHAHHNHPRVEIRVTGGKLQFRFHHEFRRREFL